MSKFYLPSSTTTTASPSPLQSPTSHHNTYQSHSPFQQHGLPSTTVSYTVSEASHEDSDDDTLPYPAPLPRQSFLSPSFSPSEYLSTLRNRHQTLEDLRSDLRTRVQELSKELIDLVNDEYEDFLGVGQTLIGGEERVEGVRVGVLGFKREVEGVRELVRTRAVEVKNLVEERRETRRGVVMGRKLLDLDERVDDLEARLKLGGAADNGLLEESEDEEDEDEDLEDSLTVGLSRLRRHALSYLQIRQMMEHVGQHPFLATLQPRMASVKETLLLDLNAALKQAKTAGKPGNDSVFEIAAMYRELGEGGEAIRVLKGR